MLVSASCKATQWGLLSLVPWRPVRAATAAAEMLRAWYRIDKVTETMKGRALLQRPAAAHARWNGLEWAVQSGHVRMEVA